MIVSRSTFAFVSFVTLAAVTGCAGGDDPKPTTSQSSTTPAGSNTGSGDTNGASTAEASVGPECTAYLACCDELAAKYPSAAASCDTTKQQLEKAQGQAQTDAVESSCKSALAQMKASGMCK